MTARFAVRATIEGQKKYRENGGTFGGPRLDKARDASALVRSKTARIRHDEFRRELAKARQAGAETSGAVAEFFNQNGYLPARAPRWTAASVRAAMKEIRIEDEAEIAAQAEAENAPPSVPDLVSLTTEELRGEEALHNALSKWSGGGAVPMPCDSNTTERSPRFGFHSPVE